jgi:hypothetical protein
MASCRLIRLSAAFVWLIALPSTARGQATFAPDAIGQARLPHKATPSFFALATSPITPRERVVWIVDGTVGPKSLGIGVIAAGWDTLLNTPVEWGQSASGFGKRYVEREIDVAISSTLEAGLGAIWGEDPRFVPSRLHSVKSRIGFAMKTTVLAPRRDGHLAPAWGRYAGNIVNNVIENPFLPPSIQSREDIVWRSAAGMAGRLIGNLWDEFWPDIHAWLAGR